jgi:selenocysteine-specific elongation factor
MSAPRVGVIAAAGKGVLTCGEWLTSRSAAAAEAERLGALVGAYHEHHPLDPGMSLQALRATPALRTVPDPIVDTVIDLGARKRLLEVSGGVVRRPGWSVSLDRGASDASSAIAGRIAAAQWQIPTVAELEREFAGAPVRGLLAHLAREGGVEQVDQERFAAPAALAGFRSRLEAVLGELGQATPSTLREHLGLTRKHLIPLLEWADRHGVTERRGDVRVLARLTGKSRGP